MSAELPHGSAVSFSSLCSASGSVCQVLLPPASSQDTDQLPSLHLPVLIPEQQVHQKWSKKAGAKRWFLTGVTWLDPCQVQPWQALFPPKLPAGVAVAFSLQFFSFHTWHFFINSMHDTIHLAPVFREFNLQTSATQLSIVLDPGVVDGVKWN